MALETKPGNTTRVFFARCTAAVDRLMPSFCVDTSTLFIYPSVAFSADSVFLSVKFTLTSLDNVLHINNLYYSFLPFILLVCYYVFSLVSVFLSVQLRLTYADNSDSLIVHSVFYLVSLLYTDYVFCGV